MNYMEQITNYSQMKNNDWGQLDSSGKKASGQQIQDFIKNALALRIGYIYEYKRAYKYVGFSDIEDFNTWFSAVEETINSKNPEIIENNLSNINENIDNTIERPDFITPNLLKNYKNNTCKLLLW